MEKVLRPTVGKFVFVNVNRPNRQLELVTMKTTTSVIYSVALLRLLLIKRVCNLNRTAMFFIYRQLKYLTEVNLSNIPEIVGILSDGNRYEILLFCFACLGVFTTVLAAKGAQNLPVG